MPIRVSFMIEGDTRTEPATGFIARLSVAGVDIETFEPIGIGDRVVLQAAFDPFASDVMTLRGRVQWVQGSRVGIQFAELGARETHAIVAVAAIRK